MVNIIGRRVGIQETGPAEQPQGLGQVLAGLGKSLFGDTLTPALKREQMQKLADENELRKAIANTTQADGNFADPRIGSLGAAFGVIDPAKIGRYRAIEGYRTEGLDSQAGQRASAGLGEFTSTPEHQQRALQNQIVLKGIEEQNKLRLADANTEVAMVPGADGVPQPTIVRRSDSIGLPSVQSSDQVKAGVQQRLLPGLPQERQQDFAFGAQSPGELGVASIGGKTVPAFVRQGGIFNAQDGQRIEQPVDSFGKLAATTADGLKPTSGDQSSLLNRRVASRSATAQIDNLDKLLSQPNADAAVGFIGRSATAFNDIRSQVEAATKLVSPGGLAAEYAAPGIKDAVDGAMNRLQTNPQFASRAQALGVQSTVLRSQIIDLAYTIAKAKDPSGRMSNQDVDRATEILGGALMDPVAGRQVLGTVKQQIAESQNIFEQEYERMYPGKGAQPGVAAPQPGVQPAVPRTMQTRSGATVTIERMQ